MQIRLSISDISPIAAIPEDKSGGGGGGGDGSGDDGKAEVVVNGGEPTPISLRHVSIEAKKVLRDLQIPSKFDGKKEGW